MNDVETNEIIDFINDKYEENVPGPVRFIVKRKVKKIKNFDLNDFPESFRKCTVEELLLILQDAHEKKQLNI